MKLRQKVLISLCFALSLGLAALSACADQAGQEPGANPSVPVKKRRHEKYYF